MGIIIVLLMYLTLLIMAMKFLILVGENAVQNNSENRPNTHDFMCLPMGSRAVLESSSGSAQAALTESSSGSLSRAECGSGEPVSRACGLTRSTDQFGAVPLFYVRRTTSGSSATPASPAAALSTAHVVADDPEPPGAGATRSSSRLLALDHVEGSSAPPSGSSTRDPPS